MTDNRSDKVLILTDEEGNMYAIPRDVVESHRVTGEEKAQLESQLGADVSGYNMYNTYVSEKLAGYNHAERLQEAAQERMARSASNRDEDPDSEGNMEARRRLRGVVTGVWRSLPFIRPTASNA